MTAESLTETTPPDDPGDDTPPLVSVVVPAFNASKTILQALSSVVRQTSSHYEIIVADDGSSDGTVEVVRSFLSKSAPSPWKILKAGGGGPGAARNHGIRVARGKYVAFLDDDDMWYPRKIAVCVDRLETHGLDLVCHSEHWRYDDGRVRTRNYRHLFDTSVPPVVSLMRNNPFSTSAVVVKRSCLLEGGLFDEEIPSAEDYDLWIRISLLPGFRIGFVDRVLGSYTVRPGSESSKIDRRMEALLQIGQRYRRELTSATPLGPLEHWVFRSRVYVTSGIRYFSQGHRTLGAWLTVKGLAMWPIRLDWVRIWVREHLAKEK